MKKTTGAYYKISSEDGYDNYGLKVKFDILIVFPENFGSGESDIWDSLELMLEARLRGLGMEMPFAKKKDVEKAIRSTLDVLNYEYERVVVTQALTYEKLAETIKEAS